MKLPPRPAKAQRGLSVQAKGARLLAVSSVKGCRLSAMCDMAVHLPLERELCPFDLAPVTSTAAQMLFGDTVAIALMQVRPAEPVKCSGLAARGQCSLWQKRPFAVNKYFREYIP